MHQTIQNNKEKEIQIDNSSAVPQTFPLSGI